MPITYAVYQVEPGGYASQPVTSGFAPSLESAAESVAKMQFKGLNPEIKTIDEITADIIIRKPEYARYKVVVLRENA